MYVLGMTFFETLMFGIAFFTVTAAAARVIEPLADATDSELAQDISVIVSILVAALVVWVLSTPYPLPSI